MMSEAQIRKFAWESSTRRVIAMIEALAAGWSPNGPSAAAACAIVNKIRAMPVPHPEGDR
jgi:hypothetical protein